MRVDMGGEEGVHMWYLNIGVCTLLEQIHLGGSDSPTDPHEPRLFKHLLEGPTAQPSPPSLRTNTLAWGGGVRARVGSVCVRLGSVGAGCRALSLSGKPKRACKVCVEHARSVARARECAASGGGGGGGVRMRQGGNRGARPSS